MLQKSDLGHERRFGAIRHIAVPQQRKRLSNSTLGAISDCRACNAMKEVDSCVAYRGWRAPLGSGRKRRFQNM